VWDTQLPAFGIRIGKHRKTFTVMLGEDRRRITVGHYPQLKLQDARLKARHILLSPPPSSPPFKDLLDDYCNLHLKTNTRATTARQTEQVLRKHFAHFYNTPIANLTRTDILRTIDALLATPAAANQALSCLGALLQWSIKRGVLESNPIAGYGLPVKLKSRERVLSDIELTTIARLTLFSTEQYHQRVALLLLTGQRLNEIGRMEWTWITHNTFTIPAHIAKNGCEHTVPLTPIAKRVISTIPNTSRFLFPLQTDPNKTSQSWSYYKRKFDKLCGFSDWTLHDLRRTWSTKAAEWRICPPHVTERILNHVSGSLTPIARVYNRATYLEEMREAMMCYETRVSELLDRQSSATFKAA
jgi:integrase